ncbi:hypothetical protein [Tessaracoccus sp.]|nr:hypothetical protein [Tessaracoccus sp.]
MNDITNAAWSLLPKKILREDQRGGGSEDEEVVVLDGGASKLATAARTGCGAAARSSSTSVLARLSVLLGGEQVEEMLPHTFGIWLQAGDQFHGLDGLEDGHASAVEVAQPRPRATVRGRVRNGR